MVPSRFTAAILVVALAVAGLSRSPFAADGFEYAKQVAATTEPLSRRMLEPGHLLWRPLAYALTPGARSIVPWEMRVREVQRVMARTSMIFAITGIVAFGVVASHLAGAGLAALIGTMLFAATAGLLTFIDAPTSYIPGLACVTLSLALAWRRGPGAWIGAAAGGAILGLGGLLWLPYALVFPAVAIGAVLVAADWRVGFRRAAILTLTCSVVFIGILWATAWHVGIETPAQALQWIGGSSHGIERRGIVTAAVGAVRGIAWVGDGPRILKRYLAHDPYNPVQAVELLRLWFWPAALALGIAACTTLVLALRRPDSRRMLLLALIAVVPVGFLAIIWSGPEIERYLPALPFLILPVVVALGFALESRDRRTIALAGLAPLGVVALVNLVMLSAPLANARAAAQDARLGCLGPALTERDLILVPHQADPLRHSSEVDLDHLPRRAGTEVRSFLPARPWHGRNYDWSEALARTADSVRREGGRAFIPSYVLEESPPALADWIEGEYRPGSWREVHDALSSLPLSQPCPGTGLLEVGDAPR